MEHGYFDVVVSAPQELFQKISSLYGKEPVLNLFKKGFDHLYSRKSEGKIKFMKFFLCLLFIILLILNHIRNLTHQY
jgi:hypothetical protein